MGFAVWLHLFFINNSQMAWMKIFERFQNDFSFLCLNFANDLV